MAVFRVPKVSDYTLMANHHLRNTSLSLKAKGLLSLMLSLPENWDYTMKGLSFICKDGVDSISSTVKELEQAGYVQRRRLRDDHGRLGDVEYTILEIPIPPEDAADPPKRENPVLENPVLEDPELGEPTLGEPITEKRPQLNTNQSRTKKSKTYVSNTHSFLPSEEHDEGQKDGMSEREKIKHQIEYGCLRQRYRGEQLDELVEIMLEVMMNRSPTIKIGRDAEYPTAYVQERLSKINAMHIERVMEGIADNRTQVYNTRAYLLATLFNSVSTIDSYNTMQYNHDFGGSW